MRTGVHRPPVSLSRTAILAVLDACPITVVATAVTYVVARSAGALPPALVAGVVGVVTFSIAATVSANVARARDERLYVTRWIVDEAVLVWS